MATAIKTVKQCSGDGENDAVNDHNGGSNNSTAGCIPLSSGITTHPLCSLSSECHHEINDSYRNGQYMRL